jgi:hypothetical protein
MTCSQPAPCSKKTSRSKQSHSAHSPSAASVLLSGSGGASKPPAHQRAGAPSAARMGGGGEQRARPCLPAPAPSSPSGRGSTGRLTGFKVAARTCDGVDVRGSVCVGEGAGGEKAVVVVGPPALPGLLPSSLHSQHARTLPLSPSLLCPRHLAKGVIIGALGDCPFFGGVLGLCGDKRVREPPPLLSFFFVSLQRTHDPNLRTSFFFYVSSLPLSFTFTCRTAVAAAAAAADARAASRRARRAWAEGWGWGM